ncbi:MAG: DUF5652 family protein [Candidatus Roizmanbacteria bacterium]|nr:DUF5652 family protein [Candidatus Roizmanbacteria bacterium]
MPPIPSELILILIAWSLAWKGFALWRAARRNDKGWYVALLFLGTAGILEALYLFVFGKEQKTSHHTGASSKKFVKKK